MDVRAMTDGRVARLGRITEHGLRSEMVRVGRLMWERGYVAATDGNLSARLSADRFLVTASGKSKGFLTEDDLLVIGPSGGLLPTYRGRGLQPSSEILMHLEVYRRRADVRAVIHAHPPLATAFSIAGVSLARCVLPEVIVALGGIPTTEYATPSTEEVPESIGSVIQEYDAVIMAHHGSLTVGQSLWDAYLRLEKVEHTAQITLAAHQLGRVGTLAPRDVERLAAMRREMLRKEGRDLCEGCAVCIHGNSPNAVARTEAQLAGRGDEEALVSRIARAVVRSIQNS